MIRYKHHSYVDKKKKIIIKNLNCTCNRRVTTQWRSPLQKTQNKLAQIQQKQKIIKIIEMPVLTKIWPMLIRVDQSQRLTSSSSLRLLPRAQWQADKRFTGEKAWTSWSDLSSRGRSLTSSSLLSTVPRSTIYRSGGRRRASTVRAERSAAALDRLRQTTSATAAMRTPTENIVDGERLSQRWIEPVQPAWETCWADSPYSAQRGFYQLIAHTPI